MTQFRMGYTTGTCAAAASKAATMALVGADAPAEVDVKLPSGEVVTLEVARVEIGDGWTEASVMKDAGDDPDVTDGVRVQARVQWGEGKIIELLAGPGIGTVTKPGLQVAPGEPAINPVPRRMIQDSAREITGHGLRITLSIPGGEEIARKTFNPRLGVTGGLSILGTSGRVRPFSVPALREALRCSLDVARATGVRHPVFTPGHIGEKACRRHFKATEDQIIQVGNEWGFILDVAKEYPFEQILVLGHPGKLAKLSAGEWDTHSSRSSSAVSCVAHLAREILTESLPDSLTVEGVFAGLSRESSERLAGHLASRIQGAVRERGGDGLDVSVVLVNMAGDLLGSSGSLETWQ